MCLKIVYVSFRQCRCWTNSNRPVFVPGADLGFWTGTTSWLWTNNGTWIAWNVANAKSVWIQSSLALHETEIFIVKKIITGKLIEYSYRFNWGGENMKNPDINIADCFDSIKNYRPFALSSTSEYLDRIVCTINGE